MGPNIAAQPNAPDPDSLLRLVWHLLRPLVRLLIVAGVTFKRFADLVRLLYVDVAMRELAADTQARTDSRISLMTGIHRKELRRQRRAGVNGPELPRAAALSSELLARWVSGSAWRDSAGRPLALPRTAPPGAPSFETLVSCGTKDVRPRTVLDQWLSQGLVSISPSGHVVLSQEALSPKPGRPEQLFYFARNLHDHIAAAVTNITARESAPFLDRSVHYDRLSPAAAGALRVFARRAAETMLLQVNSEALRLADADADRAEESVTERVNVGVYVFAEPDRQTRDYS